MRAPNQDQEAKGGSKDACQKAATGQVAGVGWVGTSQPLQKGCPFERGMRTTAGKTLYTQQEHTSHVTALL